MECEKEGYPRDGHKDTGCVVGSAGQQGGEHTEEERDGTGWESHKKGVTGKGLGPTGADSSGGEVAEDTLQAAVCVDDGVRALTVGVRGTDLKDMHTGERT